jgi:PAS domain S-box-containing protein
MTKFAKWPIRRQLLALAILLTLPVLGIIIFSGIKVRNEDYRKAALETQRLADSLAERQEYIITEARQVGGLLACLPDVKNRGRENVSAILSTLHKKNPQFQSILIADQHGIVWASSIPRMEGVDISDRRYFRNALSTRQFSSGEYAVHRVLQTPTFSMAYPLVGDKGSFDGVVILSYDLGILRSILQHSHFTVDTNYILVDYKGIVLGRGSDSAQKIGMPIQSDALKQMQEGPDGATFDFLRFDGDKRITTYRKLKLAGEPAPYMYVRVGISAKEALARANRDLLYNIAMLIPFACCAFLLALFIGKRSIADRIAKLQTASQRIAGGDLTTRVAHLVEGGELGELGRAFDAMADRLAIDIAQRRNAEEVLYKNEQRLRVIFDASQACIIMVDPDGVINFANKRTAEMFGCPLEEVIGSSYPSFLHPSQKGLGENRMHLLVSGEIDHVHSERHYLRRDGTDFWGYLSGRRLESPEGKLQALIGIIADITDRRLAEEKLRQSELKFSAAFKISPDSININRLDDGVILEVNEGFVSMLGFSEQEVLGRSTASLGIWVDLQERERMVSQLKEQGKILNLEAQLRRKDGTVIIALISSRLVEIDGHTCTLNIARDITEREIYKNELLKMQKLESLGLLAGGIAHDFNNILTGIMGNISFARLVIDESHPAYIPLANTEKASLRAADLAKQLLVFAKGGQPVKKPVSLQKVVDETIMLALSGTKVKGIVDFPVALHTVEVDEGQINQCFHNIILNAVHAMPAGGKLVIRGENVRLDAPMESIGRDYVLISFTDEGCGISEANQKKIFDPYFSTKTGGNGLGLASTHAIIARHGGRIAVESTVGSGTTFSVYLPSTGNCQREKSERESVKVMSGNDGHILVMDDEEMVRDLVTLTLGHIGYTVENCGNGEEAISRYRLAKAAGTPFSLVIMDLTIPGGMGGVEAARRILDFDPAANLIVSSGYSDDPVMANFEEYGFCAAIQKPYKVTTLAKILAGLRRHYPSAPPAVPPCRPGADRGASDEMAAGCGI